MTRSLVRLGGLLAGVSALALIAASNTAPPTFANNAELNATTTAFYKLVQRVGVIAAGDAQERMYIATNSACTVTSAVTTGTISGSTLTISAVASGVVRPGLVVSGTDVPLGLEITAFGTGTGAAGTYTLSKSIGGSIPSRTLTFRGDGGSQVPSADGNCWNAKYGDSLEWHEFGASTAFAFNEGPAQATLNAAKTLGIKAWFCGTGQYGARTIYSYNIQWEFCNNDVQLLRKSPVGVIFADAIGNHYPKTETDTWTWKNITVDMNTALSTTGGAGIILSGTNDWHLVNGNVFNIPDDLTASGTVVGAPRGTFAYKDWDYTNEVERNGWLPNGGLLLVGGTVRNVENGGTVGGMYGNFDRSAGFAQCPTTITGAAGVVLTIPSQGFSDAGAGAHNPPNGNTFTNTIAGCVKLSWRNDYGSQNTWVNPDATSATGSKFGYTLGTYGRADFTVVGTPSGTSNVALSMCATGLGSSCKHIPYSGSGTAQAIARFLVDAINGDGDLTAYHVTAGVWPNTPGGSDSASFHVDYGDEFSDPSVVDPPLNFNICGAGLPGNNTHCTGTMSLSRFHIASWNKLISLSAENVAIGAIYAGANTGANEIDMPGQTTGTPVVYAAQHAGQAGSTQPFFHNNAAKGVGSLGTTISNPNTVSHALYTYNLSSTDAQPYFFNTGAGPIEAVFSCNAESGTEMEFIDGNIEPSGWGFYPFYLSTPPATCGKYTIQNRTFLPFQTNSGRFKVVLNQLGNNTLTASAGNTAGGDWTGAGNAETTISRRAAGNTTFTSTTTLGIIGSDQEHQLSLYLAPQTSYNCTAHLSVTASGAGGVSVGTSGTIDPNGTTLTIASGSLTAQIFNGATLNAQTTSTSINAYIGGASTAQTDVYVTATLTTSQGGLFNFLAAQNASSGTATVIGANSSLSCQRTS